MTDLSRIWSETLDRRAIIKRSLDADTSIDASEDAEQLRQLLLRLELALNGAPETTLELEDDAKDASGELALILRIEAKLPGRMRPLRWEVRLRLGSQEAIAARLVKPLVSAQSVRLREVQSLVEVLREKDHLIQKLVDRLEAMGVELGHVFPTAMGKGGKPLTRKVAEERVKGLGVFDAAQWRKESIGREEENEESLEEIIDKVFGSETLKIHDPSAELQKSGDNSWNATENQRRTVQAVDKVYPSDTKASKDPSPNTSTSSIGNGNQGQDEDYFQVQATPPPRNKSHPSHPAPSPTASDTSDDLDNAPSQRSAVPDSHPLSQPQSKASSKPTKKLGTIGRAKDVARTQKKSTYPEPAIEASKSGDAETDDDTASENDHAHPPGTSSPVPVTAAAAQPAQLAKSPTPRKRSASPHVATPKTKRLGLGKIGGKKKEQEDSGTMAAKPRDDNESVLPERATKEWQKTKRKLGVTGHKAVVGAQGDETGEGEEGATGSTTATRKEKEETELSSPPEPEETAEEKADRKREELKRQLEKGKAPVKRRKKF